MTKDIRVEQRELRLLVNELVSKIDNKIGPRKKDTRLLGEFGEYLVLKDGKLWWCESDLRYFIAASKKHINRSVNFLWKLQMGDKRQSIG